MTISFKGVHFPKDVILHAVFFYLRYGVSYRGLEDIMAERGVDLDHATLNRWVGKYAEMVAEAARYRKRAADRSWRMDETYVKVKSEWVYLYRAIDKFGKTLDFMLSKRRSKAAATKIFARALEVNGMLKGFGCPILIEILRRKYLNTIIEQDHRFIKRRIRPMLGFKSFASAASALAGIELVNMIRKGQFTLGLSPFQQFAQQAG
ncbi:IS6 family transposase [Rhodobacteraceae bacterium B1Z28]|uniref:IS6 family transposase n=1 Tax=Ruegeria haliotis TaxID=2747601 RepID=A0ABX2PX97_9RHOB|nr:IS6 family transposase [Ruegeria haliotis]NVO58276.1 IS6 family transposase [Ruegeria haliotis]